MSISSPGRQKITASLTELLSIKSLSSIKVTELVRTSSVSHQTFYRYFMDKYDAAEYACYECLSVARTVVGPNSTVKDQTICLLNIVKSHSSFLSIFLQTLTGRQSFEIHSSNFPRNRSTSEVLPPSQMHGSIACRSGTAITIRFL